MEWRFLLNCATAANILPGALGCLVGKPDAEQAHMIVTPPNSTDCSFWGDTLH